MKLYSDILTEVLFPYIENNNKNKLNKLTSKQPK